MYIKNVLFVRRTSEHDNCIQPLTGARTDRDPVRYLSYSLSLSFSFSPCWISGYSTYYIVYLYIYNIYYIYFVPYNLYYYCVVLFSGPDEALYYYIGDDAITALQFHPRVIIYDTRISEL